MAQKQPDHVSRLLHFFMRNRFPEDIERKVQGWFCDERHRQEKDSAMRRFYDAMPTLESDYSRETLRELKIKLGMERGTARKTLSARRMARAAAVLLPVILAAGTALVVGSLGERRLRSEMAVEAVRNDIPRVMTLPDGSRVWLNSRSQLEYPAAFGRTRTVSVEGEAFFDVAHDPKRPFVVKAGEVSVRVHGTEFNVEARSNSPATVVTLMSGSVEVAFGSHNVTLQPLERLVCSRATHEISISKISDGGFDWRSTKLNFDRVMLSEVFGTLEAYYGVRIDAIPPQSYYDEPVSLRLTGDEPIAEVMRMLAEISGKFDCRIDGAAITVQPIHPK